MRLTKVIAFSVPPELEVEIQEHAKVERRTISEYLREAVRKYMTMTEFKKTQKKINKKVKSRKLKSSVVDNVINEIRKKS